MSTCSPFKTQVERRSVHYFSILKKYVEMREGKKPVGIERDGVQVATCTRGSSTISFHLTTFRFFPGKKHTKFLRARPKAFAIRSHGNDFRPLYLTATLSRFFHVLSLSRLSKCCIFQPHSFLNFNFLSFSLRKYVHIRRVDGKR